jgi:hypothetical protein
MTTPHPFQIRTAVQSSPPFWYVLATLLIFAGAASPAAANVRFVHAQTFSGVVTPTVNQSNVYLVYSANNPDGTSNYFTSVALGNFVANTPNLYSVTLQVPDTGVASAQVAILGDYGIPSGAANKNIRPDSVFSQVATAISTAVAPGALGLDFTAVFPGGGLSEAAVAAALQLGDQGVLQTFTTGNLPVFAPLDFSPLFPGGTADTSILDFSQATPGGNATITAVPEGNVSALLLIGLLCVFARNEWRRRQAS